MECDICSRTDLDDVGIHCTSCARIAIYLVRLEAARILLEKETLEKRVNKVTSEESKPISGNSLDALSTVWKAEITKAQSLQFEDNRDGSQQEMSRLKDEIMTIKEEIKDKKDHLKQKGTVIETIKKYVPDNDFAQAEQVVSTREREVRVSNHMYDKTVATKIFLCREAATLLGLTKRNLRANLDPTRDQYFVAGLPVPDLREINDMKCTELTAILASYSQLLVLITFYLGIRLPAEIILPHRDYPLATISTPTMSYLSTRTPFPGSGTALSLPSSPTASKHDIRTLSRPRPLFIGSDDSEEKLSGMVKKDPAAFNFFLEAISLLAWNVSWLAQSQGFTIGTDSWGEACCIGRNLHHVIFGAPQPELHQRDLPSKDMQRRTKKSGTSSPSTTPNEISDVGKLGQQSHTSAHSFLGRVTRKDQIRGWKLSSYTVIADPLKKTLVTEMNNAEWTLLDEKEADDGGERFDEAVIVKTKAMDGKEYDDARSIVTTRSRASQGNDEDGINSDRTRVRGKSGWTKMKSRDNPG